MVRIVGMARGGGVSRVAIGAAGRRRPVLKVDVVAGTCGWVLWMREWLTGKRQREGELVVRRRRRHRAY